MNKKLIAAALGGLGSLKLPTIPAVAYHPLSGMKVVKLKGDERKFALSAKAQARKDRVKKAKKNYVHPSVARKRRGL